MMQIKEYAGLIRNHEQLSAELNVNISELTRKQREEALVLAAYERWGSDMGLHINGQFAVILEDSRTHEVFATRDILGAELLFYYICRDSHLLCSTHIKSFFTEDGFIKRLNEPLIQYYLGFSYIPGEETLFEGVYKLEPGGYLRWNERDGLKLGCYWELSFDPDESKTLDGWAHDISEAMDKSLHDICDEEEQPDSFLSGGVDSSYMLAKSRAHTGFCVSYEEQDASEEEEARKTAQYLERDFEGITVTPREFFDTIDEFLRAYEQPSSDAAGLSLYCACKKVRQLTPLCFSGEGADEFFAGYNGYQTPERFEGKKHPIYFGATQAMRELDQKHYLRHFYPEKSANEFMFERGKKGLVYDTVSWMLYVDLKSYFEGSILFNSTKIADGTGLDIRMPYCDLRIFDIARRMPSRYKVSKEGNKLTLRKAASWVLPKEVAYRKKLGFPVPVRDWLADSSFNADIQRAFTSSTAEKFFKIDQIQALLDMFLGHKTNLWHKIRYRGNKEGIWRRVWSIYLFIRWYEIFFEEE